MDGRTIRSHHRETPGCLIRSPNAHANQPYGFNHGFKVVQGFVHPQYQPLFGVIIPWRLPFLGGLCFNHGFISWCVPKSCTTVQKPWFLIRFPNENTNKPYGFNHGFKVVQDFKFCPSTVSTTIWGDNPMAAPLFGRPVLQPWIHFVVRAQILHHRSETLVSDSIPQRKYQQTLWFQPWFQSGAGFCPSKPWFLIRFPNVNANKPYGFNHGFKVVQDFKFCPSTVSTTIWGDNPMAAPLFGRPVLQPWIHFVVRAQILHHRSETLVSDSIPQRKCQPTL